MKKPSVPKCVGGSQKIFLGCSTSSLAVFYVEQVALNRHVRRHFRLLLLCALRPEMSRRKKIEWWVRYQKPKDPRRRLSEFQEVARLPAYDEARAHRAVGLELRKVVGEGRRLLESRASS